MDCCLARGTIPSLASMALHGTLPVHCAAHDCVLLSPFARGTKLRQSSAHPNSHTSALPASPSHSHLSGAVWRHTSCASTAVRSGYVARGCLTLVEKAPLPMGVHHLDSRRSWRAASASSRIHTRDSLQACKLIQLLRAACVVAETLKHVKLQAAGTLFHTRRAAGPRARNHAPACDKRGFQVYKRALQCSAAIDEACHGKSERG